MLSDEWLAEVHQVRFWIWIYRVAKWLVSWHVVRVCLCAMTIRRHFSILACHLIRICVPLLGHSINSIHVHATRCSGALARARVRLNFCDLVQCLPFTNGTIWADDTQNRIFPHTTVNGIRCKVRADRRICMRLIPRGLHRDPCIWIGFKKK